MTTAHQSTSGPYLPYNSAIKPPAPTPAPILLLPPGATIASWHSRISPPTLPRHGTSAAPHVSPSLTREHIPALCPPVSASSSIQTVQWCDGVSASATHYKYTKPEEILLSIIDVVFTLGRYLFVIFSSYALSALSLLSLCCLDLCFCCWDVWTSQEYFFLSFYLCQGRGL